MDIQWWGAAVPIDLGRGYVFFVGDTRKASEVLLTRWPAEYQEKTRCRAARRVCRAALEGKAKPEKAREAFLKAAKEAHLLVGEKP